MQVLEMAAVRAAALVVSVIALVVIVRAAWRNRNTASALYVVTFLSLTGIALDIFLDSTFQPFRSWSINLAGEVLWVSNILLVVFIVSSYLTWYFAILFSEFETPPLRSFVIVAIASGALVASVTQTAWSEPITIALEIAGFVLLIGEMLGYARRVLKVTMPENRRSVSMYFLGFLVWTMTGPIGLMLPLFIGHTVLAEATWVIPYGIGVLMMSMSVAQNPKLLFISEIRVYDYLIVDQNSQVVLVHRLAAHREGVDPELMATAIAGVFSLVKELLSSTRFIYGIDHGDTKVVVEHGEYTSHVVMASRESPSLREVLRRLVLEFEATYREQLQADTVVMTEFEAFRQRVDELLAQT